MSIAERRIERFRQKNPLFRGDEADWCPTDQINLRYNTGPSGLKQCPLCGYDPRSQDAA